MTDKLDNFIYFLPELELFVPVRQVPQEELDKFYEKLREGFNKKQDGIGAIEYMRVVNKFFIKEELIKEIAIEAGCINGEERAALDSFLFQVVTNVYPVFTMDKISNLMNSLAVENGTFSEVSKDNMSMDDFVSLEKKFKSHIVGQDSAIDDVIKSLKSIGAGLETFTSLFFIGPTGVGKTELSREIAGNFTKPDRLLKINCGEYGSKHEYSKLIGSPPGYVGHDSDGILTTKAEESNEWVILFDEIEKADPKLFDLLLSLLDEGKVTDSKGKVLDFTRSIFIFTSNVGMKENLGKSNMGFGGGELSYESIKDDIDKAFEDNFSPEFINRLDRVIHFNTLNRKDARRIARKKLKGLPIKITESLIGMVVDNGFSRKFGARNINRYIKNNVTPKVADYILTNNIKNTEDIELIPVIKDGELKFTLPIQSAAQASD